jgi:hypothetical protein
VPHFAYSKTVSGLIAVEDQVAVVSRLFLIYPKLTQNFVTVEVVMYQLAPLVHPRVKHRPMHRKADLVSPAWAFEEELFSLAMACFDLLCHLHSLRRCYP